MLDRTDLKMALAAVSYYQRAHILSRRPVPPAADRLKEHLEEALSARRQEPVVPQQQWLSTKEIAERRRCSQKTAQRLARRIGHQIGRDWFVLADALPQEEDRDAA